VKIENTFGFSSLQCLLIKCLNLKSMFAVLNSDINSLKSDLLHLTGQPDGEKVDQQKSKMELLTLVHYIVYCFNFSTGNQCLQC
jgi:hypothetical protein